jgi:hypothetical protein
VVQLGVRRLPIVAALVVGLLVPTACTESARPLRFIPASLPAATAGAVYTAEIVVEDNVTPVGGASAAPGTLPDGLSLELLPGQTDTIRIAGTPTRAGTFEFTITVWCFGTNVSGQTGEQRYTITVG